MIAIIPARGGSKGLPGKNLKELNGKPLIAYSIEAALSAKGIDEIVISTDSQEIADVAVKYGAICPFLRPPELATDTAQVVDSYIYTIEKLNAEYHFNIQEFAVLQPTSPLRTSEDIEGALSLFLEKKADSVLSYVEEAHPITWHKYVSEEGKFSDIFSEDETKNRQDYRKSYYPNGAVYIFSFELIKRKKYFSENSYAYIMPYRKSIDIDTAEDFAYAEFLLARK